MNMNIPEPSNAEEFLAKSGVDVEIFKIAGFLHETLETLKTLENPIRMWVFVQISQPSQPRLGSFWKASVLIHRLFAEYAEWCR